MRNNSWEKLEWRLPFRLWNSLQRDVLTDLHEHILNPWAYDICVENLQYT